MDGAIWIEPEHVQPFIDQFFVTFPGCKQHAIWLWQQLVRQEWIVSPFGRRWFLPADEGGWRKSRNYSIQSAASDIVLIALYHLYHELRARGWIARPIGEVHDSIVLEGQRKHLKEIIKIVTRICEHVDTRAFGFSLAVPLRIDIQQGETWGTLKPI